MENGLETFREGWTMTEKECDQLFPLVRKLVEEVRPRRPPVFYTTYWCSCPPHPSCPRCGLCRGCSKPIPKIEGHHRVGEPGCSHCCPKPGVVEYGGYI